MGTIRKCTIIFNVIAQFSIVSDRCSLWMWQNCWTTTIVKFRIYTWTKRPPWIHARIFNFVGLLICYVIMFDCWLGPPRAETQFKRWWKIIIYIRCVWLCRKVKIIVNQMPYCLVCLTDCCSTVEVKRLVKNTLLYCSIIEFKVVYFEM